MSSPIERVIIGGERLTWNQVPLVYCGAGCGEAIRLPEYDIKLREISGFGAPVCWCCRMAISLEHVAQQRLGEQRSKPNMWGPE